MLKNALAPKIEQYFQKKWYQLHIFGKKYFFINLLIVVNATFLLNMSTVPVSTNWVVSPQARGSPLTLKETMAKWANQLGKISGRKWCFVYTVQQEEDQFLVGGGGGGPFGFRV
jgi:hypothetical protein